MPKMLGNGKERSCHGWMRIFVNRLVGSWGLLALLAISSIPGISWMPAIPTPRKEKRKAEMRDRAAVRRLDASSGCHLLDDRAELRGREVFFHHNQLCAEVDVVLAFAPEATMGTAIEMWEAYKHGKAVIAVSPKTHNWAVRFLSHELYADVDELQAALASGQVKRRIDEVLGRA